ncbi:MAG: hypothetical protein EHM57_07105 [Actinobacteria bacterium]|nr:MAG: hypothetical protein EHM57_07105 [Actinomycetota bacterium]
MIPVMPWPEDSLTEGEEIVTKFRQHWKLLVIPFGWFVLALIAIWVVMAWFPEGWLSTIPILAVVIAALLLVVSPIVDWLVTYYVLTTERLITRRGLIARSGIEIPLERITNVNFNQSIIERFLRAGDVIVESAGETGRSEFKNIPRPDDFQSLLYKTREARTLAIEGRVAPRADATEQLQRLKQLHDDGILSDEEYEEKRTKLIGEI